MRLLQPSMHELLRSVAPRAWLRMQPAADTPTTTNVPHAAAPILAVPFAALFGLHVASAHILLLEADGHAPVRSFRWQPCFTGGPLSLSEESWVESSDDSSPAAVLACQP